MSKKRIEIDGAHRGGTEHSELLLEKLTRGGRHPSVDVDLVAVAVEVALEFLGNDGERLVDLEEVDVVEGHAGSLQHLPGGGHRGVQHQGWAVARPGAPIEYVTLERFAKANHRGFWGFQADSITFRRPQPR